MASGVLDTMINVHFKNITGTDAAQPVAVKDNYVRLSSIIKKHVKDERPFIVSVHRDTHVVNDDTIKLRNEWSRTLVSKKDIVIVTYLPLGGGGSGGSSAGKQIGMAVGMIALMVVAPYLGGFVAGALGLPASFTVLGTAVSTAKLIGTGLVIGAGLLVSSASKSKANKKDRPLYGVSGGGNLPRPGDRIPVGYGLFWTTPDLSQYDYSIYEGEDIILFKRMTLGLGKYDIKTIKVGDSVLWTTADGIKAPFTGAQVEFLEPGDSSTLVPFDVISNENVGNNELPRPGDNPEWSGPFTTSPVGVTIDKIQLDYSFPQGIYSQSKSGEQKSDAGILLFEYAPCDDAGNPTTGYTTLVSTNKPGRSSRAQRFTEIFDVTPGRYVVRAKNLNPAHERRFNTGQWDGLRGHKPDSRVRDHVTEICLRVRSGKDLGITNFSNISVQAQRILPVWNGSAWVEQETRKAVWAFLDIMRNTDYGGNLADSTLDLAKCKYYADNLSEFDTYDGVIRGPVSVWEAASTVLGIMRAQPVQLGRMWSVIRDEPTAIRKHVFTRRNIVKDSSGISFDLTVNEGDSDWIIEYDEDCDPSRPMEVRATYGTQSLTPKRLKLEGVSTWNHANHIARWFAASGFYRRERRVFATEYDGRILLPGERISVDMWFLDTKKAASVVSRSGNTLTLDSEIPVAVDSYIVLRDRRAREFGPIQVTQGATDYEVVLDTTDLASVETSTGQNLADVLSIGTEDETVALIGTITELQENYIVKAARPSSREQITVEALYDSSDVWDSIGATIPDAPVIIERPNDPEIPTITWVKGVATQHTSNLELEWSISPAQGAKLYEIELSYDDGVTWDILYRGAQVTGNATLRPNTDQDVLIRGRAYGEAGLSSVTVQSSFSTFYPDVVATDTEPHIITYKNLNEYEAHQIFQDLPERIASIETNFALNANLVDRRVQSLEKNDNASNARIEEVWTVLAAQDESLAVRTTLIEAENSDLVSRITTEETARATQDSVIANSVTTVEAIANNATASGLFRIGAAVSPSGVLALLEMFAKASFSGTEVKAGISIAVVDPGGGDPLIGRVEIEANQFYITDTIDGEKLIPFSIIDGILYLRATQLLSYIQSSNYNEANNTGWRINNDGSAHFGGEVKLAGQLLAGREITIGRGASITHKGSRYGFERFYKNLDYYEATGIGTDDAVDVAQAYQDVGGGSFTLLGPVRKSFNTYLVPDTIDRDIEQFVLTFNAVTENSIRVARNQNTPKPMSDISYKNLATTSPKTLTFDTNGAIKHSSTLVAELHPILFDPYFKLSDKYTAWAIQKTLFFYPPVGTNKINFKLWGAGGGGQTSGGTGSRGGAGGYVSGSYSFTANSPLVFILEVGLGGSAQNQSGLTTDPVLRRWAGAGRAAIADGYTAGGGGCTRLGIVNTNGTVTWLGVAGGGGAGGYAGTTAYGKAGGPASSDTGGNTSTSTDGWTAGQGIDGVSQDLGSGGGGWVGGGRVDTSTGRGKGGENYLHASVTSQVSTAGTDNVPPNTSDTDYVAFRDRWRGSVYGNPAFDDRLPGYGGYTDTSRRGPFQFGQRVVTAGTPGLAVIEFDTV